MNRRHGHTRFLRAVDNRAAPTKSSIITVAYAGPTAPDGNLVLGEVRLQTAHVSSTIRARPHAHRGAAPGDPLRVIPSTSARRPTAWRH